MGAHKTTRLHHVVHSCAHAQWWLLCRSLTQMGTEKEDFVTLSERIGRKTGGVSFSPFTSAVKGQREPVAYLIARGKVMGDKAGDLLELIQDILLTAKLDDRERFKQVGDLAQSTRVTGEECLGEGAALQHLAHCYLRAAPEHICGQQTSGASDGLALLGLVYPCPWGQLLLSLLVHWCACAKLGPFSCGRLDCASYSFCPRCAISSADVLSQSVCELLCRLPREAVCPCAVHALGSIH